MVIEVLIGSVALVTIVGTVAGLRFSARFLERESAQPEERHRAATLLFQRAVASSESEDRRRLQAAIFSSPEDFPPALRQRVMAWLNGKPVPID